MGQVIISSYYAVVPFYFCTILCPLNPLLKISLVIFLFLSSDLQLGFPPA